MPLENGFVDLRSGSLARQYEGAEMYYTNLSNDRILYGFRRVAGRPSPGIGLSGWCSSDSSVVFGQWLSGLARFGAGSPTSPAREKARQLFSEWVKLGLLNYEHIFEMPVHDPHYSFEKLLGGLVDLYCYGGVAEAVPALEGLVAWGLATLGRERRPADPSGDLACGKPVEWYTLSENSYRAYEATGIDEFRSFGDLWCYESYWGKFADSADPEGVTGVHAYSHLNTFSGAAMRYRLTGEERYLRMLQNCYDFFQNTQCYATGGYGPAERLVPADGHLGAALDTRSDNFEAPCGTWAVFKLCRYLLEFTGEARYGDWLESVLYNGIGAALPPTPEGKNFYYADYRPSGGKKAYDYNQFACCSGSYAQAVSEYRRLIYFHDGRDLYFNAFVPSAARWRSQNGPVELELETDYPANGDVHLLIRSATQSGWSLRIRVPIWSGPWSVTVNGVPQDVESKAGSWLTLQRKWGRNDSVDISVPLCFRECAVDRVHPDRVALVRGPVVYVMDAGPHERYVDLPAPGKRGESLVLEKAVSGGQEKWKVARKTGEELTSRLRPFYAVEEGWPYRMYIDRDRLPIGLW